MSYPESRRDATVEQLHGRPIADPYRWLEDPDSAETRDWVGRQKQFTDDYLEQLPDRGWFHTTMTALVARPRAGVPFKRSGRYFVSRNDGRQNQDVWYVADSLAQLLAGGRVLVDPNTFSPDGTSSLTSLTVSPDGRLAAYGRSDRGSDWESFHVLELATGALVPDADVVTKFSVAEWLPDSSSYLYTAFGHGAAAEGTQTGALPPPQLKVHRLGTAETEDELVVEFPEEPQLMFWAEVTADERYAVLSLVEGTENVNRLWLYPISVEGGRSRLGAPLKVVDEARAAFVLVGTVGSRLFLRTDLDAERGRIVSVDLADFRDTGQVSWQEVLPEQDDPLDAVVAAADGFLAVHLVDVQPRLTHYGWDGSLRATVAETGGAVVGLEGRVGDDDAFVGFSSITSPTTSHHLDLGIGEVTVLSELVPTGEDLPVPPVIVERGRASSRDGTAVPYWLITRADADRTSPLPTLLWGYGGFKIPVFADYRPGWSGWLMAGGAVVIANLRGGGEFGTSWYDAGRLRHKQNVFDDFIGVAEHLHATGVSTPAQLAIHGRSNGGLLVGAALTQRPDLFAVALPAVGVLDMLRFHLFTIGAAWISDYGDPRDAEQFADLLGYSPLHRLAVGRSYPAVLVATGDHDDRVVPLHSHKFTAALQHAQAGEAPVLTRIEVATGHGAGKPLSLVAAEWADLLTFAAHHTGLHPTTGETDPARSDRGAALDGNRGETGAGGEVVGAGR